MTRMTLSAAAEDEAGRLSALEQFHILDTEPEERFDRVARLAARLLRTPIAIVSFLDRHRQWFKARVGTELSGTPRELAFCDHTIRGDRVLMVADTQSDARFADSAITRLGGIRFYAGAPLVTRDGHRIGTVCVLDREPRPDIGAEDGEVLAQLAAMVIDELELRIAQRVLSAELAARSHAEGRLRLLNELSEAALAAADFKSSLRVCLELIAEHVGADAAIAHGLAADAAQIELAADYAAPATGLERFIAAARSTPPRAEKDWPLGTTVREQRLVAIADLTGAEPQRSALCRAATEQGLRGWLGIPFENGVARYGLAFLFRRPLRDMSRVAETIHELTPKLRDLLARKETEERLALLQSVVLHVNDAVVIAEAAAAPGAMPPIVYVNGAFSAMTGYAPSEALSAGIELLFGPLTDRDSLERLAQALARGEPIRLEMVTYRRDGGHLWVEVDLSPMGNNDGRYTHWIVMLRETTARKHAEEQLRERELTLRQLALRQATILDALPAHVALLDREGRILSVSRSWHDFAVAAGLGAADPVGRSYVELCAAGCWTETGPALADGLAAVLSGQRQFSIDHPCDQGGWRRWYRLMAAPLAIGETSGAVVMHLDVTTSKLAEEALRREKEFSEFLIKSSSEGIVVFDRDFHVTLWNPGIERVTGMAADAVLGRCIFEMLPYLVGTAGETAMRAALDGRESSLYDQRYAVAGSGREGFYDAFFSPLYSRGREVIGGIGFVRETTERRRVEDALRQSQKMEAVGQLTGGIAHDFNNMLTVIGGNLELLESKLAADARLLRLVNSAALAASRAEKLTQQLLTFSRRQQLRPQPIDFNQIVVGMGELLHRTVGEQIEIRTQLAPELWPALADPNQIETALLNLILNARDAMPDGGHITIETGNATFGPDHREVGPGAYATLAVTDTGEGMSEEILAHVFEPFFTTKEVGKGTGLGLSQVYGFVKQSAGHVRIESQPGVGTTVRLYLPRAEAAAGSAGVSPMGEAQYRGSECVLVVEDDQGVRDFAVSVLREFGYRVVEAANGEAALDILAVTPEIDLLFTDVVMPGQLSGPDLAKAARERRPDLSLLFTSGYTLRLVEREWPASSVDLLRKPYRSVDLAARVRAVLDRARAAE
jgi:PAS domain S-box-containing protein